MKAFAGDVDAVVDVGNTLTKEGVYVNATARKFSTFNESNINICEPEGLADPDRGGLIFEGGHYRNCKYSFFFLFFFLHMPLVHKYACVYDSLCCLAVMCVTIFIFYI